MRMSAISRKISHQNFSLFLFLKTIFSTGNHFVAFLITFYNHVFCSSRSSESGQENSRKRFQETELSMLPIFMALTL